MFGLLAVAGAAYAWSRNQPVSAAPALAGETAAVRRGQVTATLSATGTVAAWSETVVRVGVGVTGTLQPFTWEPSQQVQAGEALFRLVNPTLQAQYVSDQNNLAQAQVVLGQNRAALAELSPSSPTIRDAVASVAAAAQTLASDQVVANADQTVSAPIAGTVTDLLVAGGQTVTAGEALAEIQDVATLDAVVDVPAGSVAAVGDGDPASVYANDGQASGTVTAIGVQPATVYRGVASYPVTIAVANPGGWLPGMQAVAAIVAPGVPTGSLQGLVGQLQASTSVPVPAPAAGTVSAVGVSDGQAVAAGAPLLAMDPGTAGATLQNDQAAYEQAKTALQTAVANEGAAAGQAAAALALQQLRVQALQAAVAEDRALIGGLSVRSPVAGVISSVPAVAGEPVASGTPLLTIGDYREMQVTFPVDQIYADALKVGQAAQVSTSAVPGRTYAASIYLLAPEGTNANGVATFQATLAVPQPTGLKPGMAVDVTITLATDRNTLYVPLQALHSGAAGNQFVVVVTTGGTLDEVPVTVGATDSLDAAVSGNLQAGQRVLLTSLHNLSGGQGLNVQGKHLVRRPPAKGGGK